MAELTLTEGATATIHVFTVEDVGSSAASSVNEKPEDGIGPGGFIIDDVEEADLPIFDSLFEEEVSNAETDADGMLTVEGLIPGEHDIITDLRKEHRFPGKGIRHFHRN